MATTQAQSYAAALFAKAQEGIQMLARIDSEIGSLLNDRRTVQEDLTQVQSAINEEFGRLMRESDELPTKVLAEISGTAQQNKNADHPEAATRRSAAAATV